MARDVPWTQSQAFLEASRDVRLRVDHAYSGRIPGFRGRNRFPENRLYACLDDCGCIEWTNDSVGGGALPLRAGSITFMPGGIDLTFIFEPGRMAAIHFSLEIFPGVDLFVDEFEPRQEPKRHADCRRICRSMSAASLPDSLRMQGILLQVAGGFCRADPARLARYAVLHERYAGLLAICEYRLDARTTVAGLAHELGRTRNALTKAFRRDVGMPLKRYLDRRLTRKATALLLRGYNVKETAAHLSFSSEFYFSRFFRKQTGMPPSRFGRIYAERGD